MSWGTAKDALATILASVTATVDDMEHVIARVYTEPPAKVQDVPCAILGNSSLEVDRGAGTGVERYDLTISFLLRNADPDEAVRLMEAWRAAIVAELNRPRSITLEDSDNASQADVVGELDFGEFGMITWAGDEFDGFELRLPIVLTTALPAS